MTRPTFERCSLRPLAAENLSMVLEWRNHPDIRGSMLQQHEITPAEHAAWFERVSGDPTRKLLVGWERGSPIGFVHLTNATSGGVSDWGFYAAPGAPRGSGTKLCASALDLAFRELALHKVCGQALGFNKASVRVHEKLGFVHEGVLREQHRMGATYHDVICFGLLHRDWP